LENGEVIIQKFDCALKMKILIQGHMFVSSEAVYFFSYFNDKNLFKHSKEYYTRLRVAHTDI
jgi:hypothetical protein